MNSTLYSWIWKCDYKLFVDNPSNGRGIRDKGFSHNFQKITQTLTTTKDLVNILALDWHECDQQREWDFVVKLYGEKNVNWMSHVCREDEEAFTCFIFNYDMWECVDPTVTRVAQMRGKCVTWCRFTWINTGDNYSMSFMGVRAMRWHVTSLDLIISLKITINYWWISM